MADKVAKTGVQKEKGYLYYLGKDGNVWASRMDRGSYKGGDKKKLCEACVKRHIRHSTLHGAGITFYTLYISILGHL